MYYISLKPKAMIMIGICFATMYIILSLYQIKENHVKTQEITYDSSIRDVEEFENAIAYTEQQTCIVKKCTNVGIKCYNTPKCVEAVDCIGKIKSEADLKKCQNQYPKDAFQLACAMIVCAVDNCSSK